MDTSAFVTSLVTSLLIFLVLVLLYILLSRRPGNYFVYYPASLLKQAGGGGGAAVNPEEVRLRGPFLWLREAWRVTEPELVRFAGLDSTVYIHLLDTALKILGYSAIFCIPVLVTVAALSDNYDKQKAHQRAKPGNETVVNGTFGGFDKLAMGNIEEKSPKIWVFAVGAYWLSIVTYLVLWRKYRHISLLRASELSSAVRPEQFAVLVRDIPRQSSSPDQVDGYFRKIHPNTFEKAIIVNNLSSASKLWNKLESTKAKLARAEAVYSASKTPDTPDGTRPQHKTGTLGLLGPRVDSLDHYQSEIAELTKSLQEEQKTTSSDRRQRAAILVFNDATTAAASAQSVYAPCTNKWLTSPAPEARQLIWENLSVSWYQRLVRQSIVYLIVLLTVLFYMIPIGFVSAIATLDKLEKLLPFVKHVEKITVLSTILQAYLPQLALIVFLALLPTLLLFLSKLEGIVSRSHLERAAAGKFFYFNVFNVFLGITISSSLFDAVKKIEANPNSTVSLLGESIPPAASFFITFIALKFFVGYGLQLSRLVPLIIFHLKKKYLCKTEEEVKAAWAPSDFGYPTRVPGDMLILTIALCYAVIAPMVLPFALVYFAFAWIIARHEALKVVVPAYESYGRMWPHIHTRVVAALFVSQLAMLGYFSVKKFLYAFVMVPLPVATVVFALVCNRLYYPGFKDTPLDITTFHGKEIPTVTAVVDEYTPTCLMAVEEKAGKRNVAETESSPV